MVKAELNKRPPHLHQKKIQFQPEVGADFSIGGVTELKKRIFIELWLVIAITTLLLAAGLYSIFISGEFETIQVAWAVSGPIVGMVVTHYFADPRGRVRQQELTELRETGEEEEIPSESEAALEVERIIAHLETGIPEAKQSMDVLLSQLRTTRITA